MGIGSFRPSRTDGKDDVDEVFDDSPVDALEPSALFSDSIFPKRRINADMSVLGGGTAVLSNTCVLIVCTCSVCMIQKRTHRRPKRR